MLYTMSTPDWKEAKRQTDIYLVSLQQGLSVDAADDVHEGEERNVAALGDGRHASSCSCPTVTRPRTPRPATSST